MVVGEEAERRERIVPGAQRSGLARPPVVKDIEGAARRRSSAAGNRCLGQSESPARGGRHNRTGSARCTAIFPDTLSDASGAAVC